MKLKYIDVLRGIAILGVLIVHNLLYGNNGYILSKILNFILFGQRGVQLFYFASAFTLFFSMNRIYENETYPKTNFFIRRFFRIAPMYYIGICYYLITRTRNFLCGSMKNYFHIFFLICKQIYYSKKHINKKPGHVSGFLLSFY